MNERKGNFALYNNICYLRMVCGGGVLLIDSRTEFCSLNCVLLNAAANRESKQDEPVKCPTAWNYR